RRSGGLSGRWRRRALRGRLLALFLRLSWRLRDDERGGLRLTWHACELHRREGGRGKQHEAKICHDGLVSRKGLWAQRAGTGDQQPAKGPDCGATETNVFFYFNIATT